MEVYSANRPVSQRLTFIGTLAMAGVVVFLCAALTQRKHAAWQAIPEKTVEIDGGIEIDIPREWIDLGDGYFGRKEGPHLKALHLPDPEPVVPDDPQSQAILDKKVAFAGHEAHIVVSEDPREIIYALVASDARLGTWYLIIRAPQRVADDALALLERIAGTARTASTSRQKTP